MAMSKTPLVGLRSESGTAPEINFVIIGLPAYTGGRPDEESVGSGVRECVAEQPATKPKTAYASKQLYFCTGKKVHMERPKK